MEIVDYLLARKKAGGSDVTIEQLSVTENGTYSEQGIAYSPVVVDVPAPENSYQLKDVPSGTISTIEDGTDLPMSSLKVGIEPVQDLHGYDNPWVGGAGKNKCNAQNPIVLSQAGNIGDQPCILSAGAYTFSWTSSASAAISLTLYNGLTQIGTFASLTAVQGRGNLTFEITENATSLRCYFNNATTVSDIQVELGSTATSYEPYSNICPIEGWTAANVTRSGINAFDKTQVIKNRYINDLNGNEETATGYKCTSFIRIKGGVQYYIKSDQTNARYGAFYDKEKQYISGLAGISYYNNPFNTPVNACYMRVTLCSDTSGDIDTACINISDAEINGQYYPYNNGTTYTIQFRDGDNPLTVYGGTLDVTSGELVVDRALLYADGSFNVSNVLYDPNSQLYYSIVKSNLGAPANNPSPKSDKFKPYSAVGIGNCYITNYGNYLIAFLPDQSANTVAKVTQWFADNPSQFVYELATPTTYHLTPTQIRTLVGNNNIWADTGDVLSGKYFKEL